MGPGWKDCVSAFLVLQKARPVASKIVNSSRGATGIQRFTAQAVQQVAYKVQRMGKNALVQECTANTNPQGKAAAVVNLRKISAKNLGMLQQSWQETLHKNKLFCS